MLVDGPGEGAQGTVAQALVDGGAGQADLERRRQLEGPDLPLAHLRGRVHQPEARQRLQRPLQSAVGAQVGAPVGASHARQRTGQGDEAVDGQRAEDGLGGDAPEAVARPGHPLADPLPFPGARARRRQRDPARAGKRGAGRPVERPLEPDEELDFAQCRAAVLPARRRPRAHVEPRGLGQDPPPQFPQLPVLGGAGHQVVDEVQRGARGPGQGGAGDPVLGEGPESAAGLRPAAQQGVRGVADGVAHGGQVGFEGARLEVVEGGGVRGRGQAVAQ